MSNKFKTARLPLALAIGGLIFGSLATGCATSEVSSSASSRDVGTTAVTTAVGGYVGAKEGNGQPKNAALGAAVGFVTGETLGYLNNKAQREAFTSGYEKGQSDAVKQQYWIARDNQRPKSIPAYEEQFFQIPIPAVEQDGIRREASTRVIRVVVPRKADQT